MMEHEWVVVLVTVGQTEEADQLARTLVEEKLAACCNRLDQVKSVYRWEGRICEESEILLIIKTRRDLFGRLETRVRQLHRYEVPEIIALPLIDGSDSYLRWMATSLS